MLKTIIYLTLISSLVMSCANQKDSETKNNVEGIMEITIISSEFKDGEMIPAKYTADGANVSPPLSWTPVPEGTKSIVLISDDPDAPMGTWVHWVMYNLPADLTGLPENVPAGENPPTGGKHGVTDFGRYGYGGPAPPSGTHRYFFKIYALDVMLDIKGSIKKEDVIRAMKGHVLAQGQLMGRYQRQR